MLMFVFSVPTNTLSNWRESQKQSYILFYLLHAKHSIGRLHPPVITLASVSAVASPELADSLVKSQHVTRLRVKKQPFI